PQASVLVGRDNPAVHDGGGNDGDDKGRPGTEDLQTASRRLGARPPINHRISPKAGNTMSGEPRPGGNPRPAERPRSRHGRPQRAARVSRERASWADLTASTRR